MLKPTLVVLALLLIFVPLLSAQEESPTTLSFYQGEEIVATSELPETAELTISEDGELIIISGGETTLISEITDEEWDKACLNMAMGDTLACAFTNALNTCVYSFGWDCTEQPLFMPYFKRHVNDSYDAEASETYEWSRNIILDFFGEEKGIMMQFGDIQNGVVVDGTPNTDTLGQNDVFMNITAAWLPTMEHSDLNEVEWTIIPHNPRLEFQIMTGDSEISAPLGWAALDEAGHFNAVCPTPTDGICNYQFSQFQMVIAVDAHGGTLLINYEDWMTMYGEEDE